MGLFRTKSVKLQRTKSKRLDLLHKWGNNGQVQDPNTSDKTQVQRKKKYLFNPKFNLIIQSERNKERETRALNQTPSIFTKTHQREKRKKKRI